jgi:arsenical pump membrane protein
VVATIFIWAISLASIAGVLTRPRRIAEAWWACLGASLLVVTGLLPLAAAGMAVRQGVDVYFFLAGMMILAELAREKGVFDWIATLAARHAQGSPRRLFLLIYLAGTVVTAFLSNDATAVVLTPAVLTIVRRLEVNPRPHLLACAFIANAASFILPISNPANLVIFGNHLPPLSRWLAVFLLPSIPAVLLTYLGLRLLSRRDLAGTMKATLPATPLSVEGRLALGGLVLAAGVMIGASALGFSLGAPTCVAALAAAGIVTWHDRRLALTLARNVSWSVIPLVAGLFVLVAGLQRAGALDLAVRGLRYASRLGQPLGHLAVAWAVALLSNVMNNLPVGLLSGKAVQAAGATSAVHAVLIGVDLGPNLSVTGSLATILWLIALRRERVEITFWEFLRVGLVVMPVALFGAVLVLR